jgi:hypothetical protein
LPPIGKQKIYPALDLSVLHVRERDAPPHRQPLEWKLITRVRHQNAKFRDFRHGASTKSTT